jgi:hypothetical protein
LPQQANIEEDLTAFGKLMTRAARNRRALLIEYQVEAE